MFHSQRKFLGHSLLTIFLASLAISLLTFLTPSALVAAPSTKQVKVLNLNDRLKVKGQGCQPQIQKQKESKIGIKCVAMAAQFSQPNAPLEKAAIVLVAGDKLVVKRNACRLQLIGLTNKRVVVVCDSGPLPPIIPDTTSALTSETTQYLESVTPDGATFTFSQMTDELNSLQAGDIVVSNPAPAAPEGFLRKVTSISSKGGEVTVETEATTLAEAVQQGEISVSQVLQPTNLERATFARGVEMIQSPDAPQSFSLRLNNVILYDQDGNENTTTDQVIASGSITLVSNFDFRLKVEDFQLQELYFTETANETSQLQIASKVFVTAKAEKVLAVYPLGPLFLTIGPVPVTVYPVITIVAGLDGTIQSNVSMGVTQTVTMTGGGQYKNGAYSTIKQFSNDFHHDPPSLSTGLAIKGYTGVKLKILFYGSVGPDVALNAYLKLEADLIQTPWWNLYGGLEVPVGISIDIFSHVIAGWNAVVIDYRKVLAQAETPPPTVQGIKITAGGAHTCALTDSSKIMCWGANTSGELGDGTTDKRLIPVNVEELVGKMKNIAAGNSHTCALTKYNGVKCWGKNSQGQLGDGTTNERHTPRDVYGLTSGVIAIAAGGSHTCALTSGGGVKCWGYNDAGQLGNGTGVDSSVPVDVYGLTSGVMAIAAGEDHTCAILINGRVKCWGFNQMGELGDGTNIERDTPVYAKNVIGAAMITTGTNTTCALIGVGISGGWTLCWGANDSGQLGDGTTENRYLPVTVKGMTSGVIAIQTSFAHTCALTIDGAVKCWGSNYFGQLGDGTRTDRHLPTNVSGLTNGVIAISNGSTHTCAILENGGIKCWGSNRGGQLGDGTTSTRFTPVNVVGFGP